MANTALARVAAQPELDRYALRARNGRGSILSFRIRARSVCGLI